MIVADTSVWVDYLRHGSAGRAGALDRLLGERTVAMCGPVAAELVAGAGGREGEVLWRAMSGLPWAELDRDAWRAVGTAAAELRANGASVPLTDVEIAVAAVRLGAGLWTRDVHFERVAAVVDGLELVEP